MSKKIRVFLILTLLILLAGTTFAIVDINLPLPEPVTGSDGIAITANGVSPSGGEISVTEKNLTIDIENVATGKKFYVAINKDIPEQISEISTSKNIQKNPLYDYIQDNLSAGMTIQVQNIENTTTKEFQILNWDSASDLKITVCQDQDNSGSCTGNERAAVSIKSSAALTTDLKFSQILNANNTKIADLSAGTDFAFKNPENFILKIENINPNETLYISSGSETCEKIVEGRGGLANLSPVSTQKVAAAETGGFNRNSARWLAQAAGYTLKESFFLVTNTAINIFVGLYEGIALPESQYLGEIRIQDVINKSGSTQSVDTEISLPNDNILLNKSIPFNQQSHLKPTMYLKIAQINGTDIKSIAKGTSVSLFACQKSGNQLAPAKATIKFGENSVPVPAQCTNIFQCMANIGKIFSQQLAK